MRKLARPGPGLTWITSSREIRSLKKSGRLFRGKRVYIWISPTVAEDQGSPRVGLVTGRGFDCATRRNLARRRVRGCVMDLRHRLQDGYSYLVECRPGVEEGNYQFLVIVVDKILRTFHCNEKETANPG